MVSWAAALKIDSESRRRWGRWKPSTDEEYAKTTLTMVLAAQKEVAEKLRHSWGGADLVEDEVLLQELGKWLEERCFTELRLMSSFGDFGKPTEAEDGEDLIVSRCSSWKMAVQ